METLTKRHESVSEETATKLRQVVAAMTPKELYMREFGRRTECGTTYCLAGKAVAMFAPDKLLWDADGTLNYPKTASLAMDILGCPESLFYVEEWPDEFGERYEATKDGIAHLSILQDRVEHYIATAK